MLRHLIVVGLILTLAGPVTPDAGVVLAQDGEGQDIPGWGTLFDPEGGATVASEGDSVELTVPGSYRDLWPEGRVNAPRILTPVQGDFSVVVKVPAIPGTGTDLAPDRPDAARWPVKAAALLVWQDEGNFVRFERLSSQSRHSWHYHTFDDGKRLIQLRGELKPDVATHLWIARQKGTFHAGYRQEGDKDWTRLETHRLGLPDQVQVGVSLVNSTSEAFTARFEQFKVSEGR